MTAHPAAGPDPLPIRTRRLRLRDFTPADLEAVHRYASDPRVTCNLCWGPNDRDRTRAFLETVALEADGRPRATYHLGIEVVASGAIVGGIHIRPHGGEPRAFELGYCLRPDHWGYGLASEAAAAIVSFGFRELGARQLVAEVFLSNAGSVRILEKLGFQPGDPFERHVICRDERHQARLFTLTLEGWLKRHP